MDISPHGNHQDNSPLHQTPADAEPRHSSHQPVSLVRKHLNWKSRTIRYSLFVILVGSAFLMSAVSLFLSRQTYVNPEAKQVNTKEYQAVFITNTRDSSIESAVYFGKITAINSRYIVLRDIFYIQNDGSGGNAQSQLKLIKLGGELHAPEDQMVINRSQMLFWENLKDSGDVVKKINEYKANPSAAPSQNSSTKKSQ